MPGTLYLVATPIGNLQDISSRAIETLKDVDIIACEDTRHTRKLLHFYAISGKLVSYHEHNEAARSVELIRDLLAGSSVAIVSDAGTPAINDPGFVIVQKAIESGIEVVPIPGAAAFVTAVIASGLATDSIFFGGFLPSRKGERRKRLQEVVAIPATLIFYESPNRLVTSLTDCVEILGNRKAAYARELTKLHEEFIRGDLQSLTRKTGGVLPKGEIVLMIDRQRDAAVAEKPLAMFVARVREIEALGADPKAALKQAAREFRVSKSEAYRRVQAEKDLEKH